MKDSTTPFVIAIPVYDGVDLMDIAAPREVFSFMEDAGFNRPVQIYCVGDKKTYITRDNFQICSDENFQSRKVKNPNLIWIPGGDPDALADMLARPKSDFFRYIMKVAPSAEWITSVCEGAILLASTDLLDGYEITTHWAFYPCMTAFPRVNMVPPTESVDADGNTVYDFPRHIKSGNRITGGGISSGLDEALYIVKILAGDEVAKNLQATIQYFPKPPVQGNIVPNDSCPVPGLIS